MVLIMGDGSTPADSGGDNRELVTAAFKRLSGEQRDKLKEPEIAALVGKALEEGHWLTAVRKLDEHDQHELAFWVKLAMSYDLES